MTESSPVWARVRRAITWGLLVGISLAGAVAAALTPQGQARIAVLTGQSSANGAPMATGVTSALTPEIAMMQDAVASDLRQRLAAIETAIQRLDAQDSAIRETLRDIDATQIGVRAQLDQVTGSIGAPEAEGVVLHKTPPTVPLSGRIAVRTIPIEPYSAKPVQDVVQSPKLADEQAPVVSLALPAPTESAPGEESNPVPMPTLHVTDFGIELARAATIDELEAEWTRLSASQKADFTGLEPRISLDFSSRNNAKLVLIAGPIRNARDAAQLCAMLSASGERCRTVPFGEDTVALNAQR